MSPKIAWWFAYEPKLPNGDGRPVVIGESHKVTGKLELCKNALHWSREPFDALRYARGVKRLLYKVRPEGEIIEDPDKGGSRGRTYLDMREATDMVRSFARSEALGVAHLWDCPPSVRRYLETGDETIHAAALNITKDIANYTNQEAAWAAFLVDDPWGATMTAAAAMYTTTDTGLADALAAAKARFNTAVYNLFGMN